jgi:hypothetical protein
MMQKLATPCMAVLGIVTGLELLKRDYSISTVAEATLYDNFNHFFLSFRLPSIAQSRLHLHSIPAGFGVKNLEQKEKINQVLNCLCVPIQTQTEGCSYQQSLCYCFKVVQYL